MYSLFSCKKRRFFKKKGGAICVCNFKKRRFFEKRRRDLHLLFSKTAIFSNYDSKFRPYFSIISFF